METDGQCVRAAHRVRARSHRGRYQSIDHERSAPRTVFPLARDKPLDLFDLRQRYTFLAPLLDAQYGSASYVAVSRPAEIELRGSSTGLLMREVKPVAQ